MNHIVESDVKKITKLMLLVEVSNTISIIHAPRCCTFIMIQMVGFEIEKKYECTYDSICNQQSTNMTCIKQSHFNISFAKQKIDNFNLILDLSAISLNSHKLK